MGEEEERLPDSEGVTQPRPTERGRIPSPPLPGSSARGRTSPEPALLLHQGGGIANVSQGSHVSLSACTCAFVPVCFGDKCRVQLFLEVPRRHPGSRKVGLGGGQRACGTKVLAQNQVKPGFSPPAALLQLRKPSRPPYQTEENPPNSLGSSPALSRVNQYLWAHGSLALVLTLPMKERAGCTCLHNMIP